MKRIRLNVDYENPDYDEDEEYENYDDDKFNYEVDRWEELEKED